MHWGYMHTYTHTSAHTQGAVAMLDTKSKLVCASILSVNMFAQHVSSILLTHRESAVLQGQLSCETEAAAKPFISRHFKKLDYTLNFL